MLQKGGQAFHAPDPLLNLSKSVSSSPLIYKWRGWFKSSINGLTVLLDNGTHCLIRKAIFVAISPQPLRSNVSNCVELAPKVV